MNEKSVNVRNLALIGVLGALGAVLLSVNIPVPFAPSFMKIDVAELPSLFAGFFIGPLGGTCVILIKLLLKLLIQGTDTAFVGEFSNLFHSLAFVLPAAVLYRRRHTKRGAIEGLIAGSICACIVAVLSNAYVMFPLYAKLYGMPMEALIGMGSAVNPLVHDELSMMMFSVLPFNIVKCGLTSLLTYLIYKRAGTALRHLMSGHRAGAAKM